MTHVWSGAQRLILACRCLWGFHSSTLEVVISIGGALHCLLRFTAVPWLGQICQHCLTCLAISSLCAYSTVVSVGCAKLYFLKVLFMTRHTVLAIPAAANCAVRTDFLYCWGELFSQVLRLRRYKRSSVQNRRFCSNGGRLTLNFR